jgi:diguanylate cyclase (GGDEF)-like protein/PAS domain S-box-containing protein
VRSSPDVVVVVDAYGRIVYVNERCEAMLGYSPGELLGREVETLVPGDAGRHVKVRVEYQRSPAARPMGQRPVLLVRHKSGARIPVDIALSPLPAIARCGVLVQAVIRDARARERSEHEQRLRSIAMDAAANGIVITDAGGIIEWVNPAVTRMTGYASDELVGRHTRLLKSGLHGEAFYAELWRTIVGGETWYGEIANRRKDGTIYYEEQYIAPVRNEEGAVTHFIAIKQDVTARRVAEMRLQEANDELERRLAEVESLQQQLREQAIRDPLTQLFNRRYLDETLRREANRARRGGLDLAVILLDVDGFKQLNDAAGHAAGDAMLRSLGRLLAATTRESDIACRLGGDEFLVVMPGAGLEVARRRAEMLRRVFVENHDPGRADPAPPTCSLSIGVSQLQREGDTTEALLERADKALYRAKRSGRNRVVTL